MDDVPLRIRSADRGLLVVELPDNAVDGQRRISLTTGAWATEVFPDIRVGRSQSAGINPMLMNAVRRFVDETDQN
jgi:hypothetical protein